MPYSEQEKESIRAYVSRNFENAKYKRRIAAWVTSVIMYVLLLFIAVGAADGGEFDGAFVLMITAGAISIMIHALSAALESKEADRRLRRRLIEEYHTRRKEGADLEAEIFGDADSDEQVSKRKNEQTYRLSDDGELIPESEFEAAERRQQRRA